MPGFCHCEFRSPASKKMPGFFRYGMLMFWFVVIRDVVETTESVPEPPSIFDVVAEQ